jgi:hypothetical protein
MRCTSQPKQGQPEAQRLSVCFTFDATLPGEDQRTDNTDKTALPGTAARLLDSQASPATGKDAVSCSELSRSLIMMIHGVTGRLVNGRSYPDPA